MKPIKEELAEVPDLGFAGLAWRAKVHIESLEKEIEFLKDEINSLTLSMSEEQTKNTQNYKSEHGE